MFPPPSVDLTELEAVERLGWALHEATAATIRARRTHAPLLAKIEDADEVFSRAIGEAFARPVPLIAPPRFHRDERLLPFERPHDVRVERFRVLQSGLGGGATVDVLFQVWIDTETMRASFGVPLVFREIAPFGPVDPDVWAELREVALALQRFTSAARFAFVAEPEPFVPCGWDRRRDDDFVRWLSGIAVVGLRSPARPPRMTAQAFAIDDIVSGWIGDVELGGESPTNALHAFVKHFHVRQIVRVILEALPSRGLR